MICLKKENHIKKLTTYVRLNSCVILAIRKFHKRGNSKSTISNLPKSIEKETLPLSGVQ